jgi:hypothetical protein
VMVTKIETAVMNATIVKSAALSSSRRRRNMGEAIEVIVRLPIWRRERRPRTGRGVGGRR